MIVALSHDYHMTPMGEPNQSIGIREHWSALVAMSWGDGGIAVVAWGRRTGTSRCPSIKAAALPWELGGWGREGRTGVVFRWGVSGEILTWALLLFVPRSTNRTDDGSSSIWRSALLSLISEALTLTIELAVRLKRPAAADNKTTEDVAVRFGVGGSRPGSTWIVFRPASAKIAPPGIGNGFLHCASCGSIYCRLGITLSLHEFAAVDAGGGGEYLTETGQILARC